MGGENRHRWALSWRLRLSSVEARFRVASISGWLHKHLDVKREFSKEGWREQENERTREFTFKTIILVIYIIGSFPIRVILVPYTSAFECGFIEMPLGLVWLWLKVTWHTAKYGDPYSEFVLCIYGHLTHPKCTHTAMNTHTHHEHTPGAVGSHLCCGVRGAVGGSVPCLREPQSWYWGWRELLYIHSPTNNSCRTWDSNSQPLDYESDSLTIRPRLPLKWNQSDPAFSLKKCRHICLFSGFCKSSSTVFLLFMLIVSAL